MNIGEIRTDMKTYFQVAVKDGLLMCLLCSWQERNV